MDDKWLGRLEAGGRAASESDVGSGPVEFRIMRFQPIGAEDEVVCANGCDIELRVFLVEILEVFLDMDGLDGSRANGAGTVHGSVNIFYG